VVREDLIVEFLDSEALVYDGEDHGAHLLRGEAVEEFAAARDDLSRREILRRSALAGVTATGAILVQTIVSPTPAQAQSGLPCLGAPGDTCPPSTTCCTNVATGIAVCCAAGQTCCQFSTSSTPTCCTAGQVCNGTTGCATP
jgi:hypothetical protein